MTTRTHHLFNEMIANLLDDDEEHADIKADAIEAVCCNARDDRDLRVVVTGDVHRDVELMAAEMETFTPEQQDDFR